MLKSKETTSYNKAYNSLPNEIRDKLQQLNLCLSNLENDIEKMKMDGEITKNQYKNAYLCLEYLTGKG